MSDWRSKPRNGKADFMNHKQAIEARIDRGLTYKAILEELWETEGLALSQSQFNRYVKAFITKKAEPLSIKENRVATAHAAPPASGVRRFTHNPTPPDDLLE
jgi:hypothetical protein